MPALKGQKWHTYYGKHIYSRRQYKVSVPLKKNRCPTAYQRFKKTVYRF